MSMKDCRTPSSLATEHFPFRGRGQRRVRERGASTVCPQRVPALGTFRAHFGSHNSLCTFRTKSSRGTPKLCSYFHLQHMKRPALQIKQVRVLRMAFRARKVFGTFEKRAPAHKGGIFVFPALLATHNCRSSCKGVIE